MKRREFLEGTAALAVAGAIAGCISGGGDGGDGGDAPDGGGDATATETATPTETTTPTETPTATPTPEPTTVTTAEVGEFSGECGGMGHEASVTFADGSVRVDGAMQTPNPCYEAELSAAEYDEDADELAVTVTAVAQDRMCQQCVGTLSYEATVGYDGAAPGTVTVTHVVDEERTTVTTASNRSAGN